MGTLLLQLLFIKLCCLQYFPDCGFRWKELVSQASLLQIKEKPKVKAFNRRTYIDYDTVQVYNEDAQYKYICLHNSVTSQSSPLAFPCFQWTVAWALQVLPALHLAGFWTQNLHRWSPPSSQALQAFSAAPVPSSLQDHLEMTYWYSHCQFKLSAGSRIASVSYVRLRKQRTRYAY